MLIKKKRGLSSASNCDKCDEDGQAEGTYSGVYGQAVDAQSHTHWVHSTNLMVISFHFSSRESLITYSNTGLPCDAVVVSSGRELAGLAPDGPPVHRTVPGLASPNAAHDGSVFQPAPAVGALRRMALMVAHSESASYLMDFSACPARVTSMHNTSARCAPVTMVYAPIPGRGHRLEGPGEVAV